MKFPPLFFIETVHGRAFLNNFLVYDRINGNLIVIIKIIKNEKIYLRWNIFY